MTNHAGKIAGELAAVADKVQIARDNYYALVADRDDLIYRLIDLGMTNTEIAEYAGLTRAQVSRMANRR